VTDSQAAWLEDLLFFRMGFAIGSDELVEAVRLCKVEAQDGFAPPEVSKRFFNTALFLSGMTQLARNQDDTLISILVRLMGPLFSRAPLILREDLWTQVAQEGSGGE
jgi:hypothetical protein